MSFAWFLCPIKLNKEVRIFGTYPLRYWAMDDFTQQILSEGGWWAGCDALGNVAVCKVRASDALLAVIEATPEFMRWPKDGMNDPLGDLTDEQIDQIKSKLLELGYTMGELRRKFGGNINIAAYTLKDVLDFVTQKKIQPRYDDINDDYIFDGAETGPRRTIESIDQEVT